MFDVMLKLQTKTFPSGEPVKARLKCSVVSSMEPSPAPLHPVHQLQYDPEKVTTMYAPQLNNRKKASFKARKNKVKNQQQSGNNNNSTGSKQNPHENNSNAEQTNRHIGKQDSFFRTPFSVSKAGEESHVAPKLGEDDFPLLPPSEETQINKIEVEKVPDSRSEEDEFAKNHMGAGFSDSSSTATTSTSSTPPPSQPRYSTVMGGYAAALLKPAVPVPASNKSEFRDAGRRSKTGMVTNSKGNACNVSKCGKKESTKTKNKDERRVTHPPVVVQPPSWGGGMSFADVLRRKEKEIGTYS
jgi:hypothetical protein